MVKLPRDVSGQDALRAFDRAGFIFKRKSKKGHFILARRETVLSVPDHRHLKDGTLRRLIRDAGLTVEDFERQLRKNRERP